MKRAPLTYRKLNWSKEQMARFREIEREFHERAFGEELGWRGFALPRLLEARTPLNAAIVLGLIWFAWHLPTFFISTLSQSQLPIALFCVNSIALSILMTWVYLRTAGDLFAMILIHTMANWCGAIGIPFPVEVLAEVGLAALVAVAGGLRRSGETLMPVEA